jgi:hypothetical protein
MIMPSSLLIPYIAVLSHLGGIIASGDLIAGEVSTLGLIGWS